MTEIYESYPEALAVNTLSKQFALDCGDSVNHDVSTVLMQPDDTGSVESLKFGCSVHKFDGHMVIDGPYSWQIARFTPRVGTRTLTYTEQFGGARFTEARFDEQMAVQAVREANPTELYENLVAIVSGQVVADAVARLRSNRATSHKQIADFVSQARDGAVAIPYIAERLHYELDDCGDVVVRKKTYPSEKVLPPHDKQAKKYLEALEKIHAKKFFMPSRFLEPVDGKIERVDDIQRRKVETQRRYEDMRQRVTKK